MTSKKAFDFNTLFGSLTTEVTDWLRKRLGASEKIKYFVADGPAEVSQDFWAIGALDGDRTFVESLIKRVDAVVDLDFVPVARPQDALIGFYRFDSEDKLFKDDDDPNTLGVMMYPWETGRQQLQLRYKTTLKNAAGEDENFVKGFGLLGVTEASSIAHEFGHGIGLSHPQNKAKKDDPDDPNGTWHDTRDTIMSYNDVDYAVGQDGDVVEIPGFTAADLKALQFLWGRENDADRLVRGDQGNNQLKGGPGWDKLYGMAGNDVIRAGAGDDVIDPGPGDDRVWGEAGLDLFQIGKGPGYVQINDFESGRDRVQVRSGLQGVRIGTLGGNAAIYQDFDLLAVLIGQKQQSLVLRGDVIV